MADSSPNLASERHYLTKGIKKISPLINASMIEQLLLYYQLFRDKNKALGLSSLTRPKEILYELFLDSLALLPWLFKNSKSRKLLDIGTGAGFPGLPLKIACPDLDLTLMDASGKKLGFCRLVALSLKISKVEFLQGRVEELAHDQNHRESFDLVCAKAVAKLPILLEYGIPFLKTRGTLVAYKGEKFSTEITQASHAFNLLKAKYFGAKRVSISSDVSSRYLVFVEKLAETPKHYPRKPHMIKNIPL